MEFWLLVVVLAAFVETTYSSLQKHLTVEFDGLELSYITSVLGLAFLVPVGLWILFTTEIPITPMVAAVILLSGTVNIAAIYAFLTALKIEDLSVVAPLVQLSPIFVAFSEPVFLATPFNVFFIIGAFLAVGGSFILLADERAWLRPLAHVSTRAAILAISAAAFFSVASLSNRYVTTRISPMFYTFLIYFLMTAGFAIILAVRRKRIRTVSLVKPKLVSLGGLTALRTSLTYFAFSLAAASRVTVSLQLSILFSVIAGGLLFGERQILRKLLGGLLIILGIVFVV